MTGWIIYPLIGYYLNTATTNRKWRIALYLLGIASIAYHFLITYLMSTSAGALKIPASEYAQFHVILTTSAVFVFAKNLKLKLAGKCQDVLRTLSGCSFGVYLIHIPFMLLERQIFQIAPKSIIYRFFFPFLTYAICVGVVLLLKKIPFLRRIVP